MTTDEQGRFVIHHVAADQGVLLRVEGTDRFALQEWAINTGLPKEPPAHDDTYRPQVRNYGPGEEAVLQLLPAQIFEGVVRYADTGEPAPRARLIILSSQHGGSWMTTAGTADAQGRYRLNPYPGRQFGLTAYPPDGAPYLIRQVGPIAWAEGAAQKQVDMILPRGILVRGRVVEAGTNAAVAGATIQYVPEDANNPYTADGIVTGFLQWLGRALSAPNNPPTDDEIVTGRQGIQLSAEDGRFEITVLPGPGRVLAHGPFGEFVLQEIGSRQLHQGRPGGGRHYAHAILRVNPEPKSDPIPVTLELQRGAKVAVRLLRENGEPVDESAGDYASERRSLVSHLASGAAAAGIRRAF